MASSRQTDIIEDAKVVVEELQQNKADNISKWSGGMLEFLDETERNKVLEVACNLQINQNTRLHKTLVQYKKDIADYKSIHLVKELVNKAEDYRIAKEIREYIQAMIDSGSEDITPEWIEWAEKKADWYDPSIATEDEYLGKRQHEKSAEEKEKSLQDSIRKNWYL